MTVKASRRASPDLLAINPISMAANRNQAVSFAKPLNATLNRTTPSAQNRKHPMKPASANSVACVIQAMTINDRMANPCLVCGSRPIGENQMANGTMTHSICPARTNFESISCLICSAALAGTSTVVIGPSSAFSR